MTKAIDLTFDQVNDMIAYDPATGSLTWKIDAAKNIKAGTTAGTSKGVRVHHKTGQKVAYRYIRLLGVETPASRVAWLLSHGEWPASNVLFKDDNPSNLAEDNLRLAQFPTVVSVSEGGRRSYKMAKEQQRHYGLKRYYGLTGEQYGEMLAAQKGVCAICGKPETAMFNGVPKVMHVDHDHATNAIRELLCGSCNGMLGLAKDDPQTLRAAADYIEKHAARTDNVTFLPINRTPQ